MAFTGGAHLDASGEVATGLRSVGSLSVAQLKEFVALVIGFFLDSSTSAAGGANLMSSVSEFAQKHGVKGTKALKTMLRSLLVFFKGCLRQSLTPSQVKCDFVALGVSEEAAAAIGEAWKVNFVSLSRSMMGKIFMVNELIDVEWKFGVTGSTDEIEQVGETFLQLKLLVDKPSPGDDDDNNNPGKQRQHIALELTLDQFYKFLASMQEAKSHLDFLSAS